jgi:uncharacterized protein (DUF983 family)
MRFRALLSLRCPRCFEGRVYEGLLRMHRECPRCGLLFQREPGYFLGAMYFSYALAILAALPLCLTLLVAGVPALWNALASSALIAVVSPLVVRYSRVLWLHFDHRIDPR